ncbi:MAG: DnaD domain protein [Bacilli bacterium]|nr:DnaD domain protein [Bacilli bacterium]
MKSSRLIEIFRDGNLVVPIYLLKNYKDLKLELNEFIYLMYLYNRGDNLLFDPNTFAKELNMDLTEIMELTSKLTEKGFISVEVSKNEKGFMEEVVILDNFYNKLKMYLLDDLNKEEEKAKDNTDIFEVIEKEFGRTLSSMEYEIIKAWRDSNISDELITEALREAVLNGVNNLKYIDKILYEWGKKGIKTAKDVEDNRKKRRAQMEKNKDTDSDVDLGVLDGWLDDE